MMMNYQTGIRVLVDKSARSELIDISANSTYRSKRPCCALPITYPVSFTNVSKICGLIKHRFLSRKYLQHSKGPNKIK